MNPSDVATLLDWKRQVFSLYERIRGSEQPRRAWDDWCETRSTLFKEHPQSPIPAEERADYRGIPVFDYQDDLRTLGRVQPAEPTEMEIGDSGGTAVVFTRFATVHFDLAGAAQSLDLFWLNGYGGGVFLPFRDATAGLSTYGAGRYLYDTVKGADLGGSDDQLILDFNFAYNPSCSYDAKWVCPLAPPGNRLDVPVEAGERLKEEGPPSGSPS